MTKTTTLKLSDFASTLASENSFIKASFGGFAGSGKTRTSAEFIAGLYKKAELKKPLLIIDNEKGSRFLVPFFKSYGIETMVKETVHLADILKAFEYVGEDIDCLFIDSLTKVWYQFVRDYKKNNNRVFMTLQDWGKVLPDWQEKFADVFVQLEGNCVFTGRGGYTYDMEEREEGGRTKKEFVKSGVKMKMAGETPFETDLNVWMGIEQEMTEDNKPHIWREALIIKDRSGLIDGQTFKNPTFKDFEPVVDYLLTVDKGEIQKASDTTNLSAKESYDDRRKQREIIFEKWEAEFQKRQLGTGKEEKAIKALMIEKCWGTLSTKEMEGFPVEKLQHGLDRFNELLGVYDQAEDKITAINEHEFSLLMT